MIALALHLHFATRVLGEEKYTQIVCYTYTRYTRDQILVDRFAVDGDDPL
jgi:hypothetical protein